MSEIREYNGVTYDLSERQEIYAYLVFSSGWSSDKLSLLEQLISPPEDYKDLLEEVIELRRSHRTPRLKM
jgi:hypothetical protein